jgi:hypothetical protein
MMVTIGMAVIKVAVKGMSGIENMGSKIWEQSPKTAGKETPVRINLAWFR